MIFNRTIYIFSLLIASIESQPSFAQFFERIDSTKILDISKFDSTVRIPRSDTSKIINLSKKQNQKIYLNKFSNQFYIGLDSTAYLIDIRDSMYVVHHSMKVDDSGSFVVYPYTIKTFLYHDKEDSSYVFRSIFIPQRAQDQEIEDCLVKFKEK